MPSDTIVAEATPPGFGGVAIVRVSGGEVPTMIPSLLARELPPRQAVLTDFLDAASLPLDRGIAIYYPESNSFTGEHVLELHGHGGPMVVSMIIERVLALGARLARPGEFSERAFLNGKMDLTQAEAIADLIHASSQDAARLAFRSMQGAFAERVNELISRLTHMRVHVEAAIDFSDEDIPSLNLTNIEHKLQEWLQDVTVLLEQSQEGYRLREGLQIVIVGEPNVGKSSLLNQLARRPAAIVTPLAGTTRDLIREEILLDNIPLHIVDTAGLRESDDIIEQEGMQRAKDAFMQADLILHVMDASRSLDKTMLLESLLEAVTVPVITIFNKIDLCGDHSLNMEEKALCLSAKTGTGIDLLKAAIKQRVGLQRGTEGIFLARLRHIDALNAAKRHVELAKQLFSGRGAFELIAEELRLAQEALFAITGVFTSDELLGVIFSSFCIGK